jgi:nucleoside-diphosphate-sugar epimerase
MKLLIVGGTGCLSLGIAQEALNQNIEVYMINRGNRMDLIPEDVHFKKADIKDKGVVTSLLSGLHFDAVIDCICWNLKDIENSLSLFKLLTDQYVFVSTCAVYNVLVNRICDENSLKVMPYYGYSINKNRCEEYLRENARKNNINYTIVRASNTYGNDRIPYTGSMPCNYFMNLTERVLNGKPIITWNNGENRINITHVKDFAFGVIGLLGNPSAYNEDFNIVGDETPSRREILNALSEVLQKEIKTIDVPVEYYAREIPHRKGDVIWDATSSSYSNKKIKSVVKDFRQNITYKDGIKMTIDNYQNHKRLYRINYCFDGLYDRVIQKYLKEKNIRVENFNLNFINYLKVEQERDKLKYLCYRYINWKFLKMCLFPLRMLKNIFRFIRNAL